jgi:glycosyltransferase involved in cell wall biosynthesis
MHYAVPRILSAAGALDTLFTDSWDFGMLARLPAALGKHTPALLRRAADRMPCGIPPEKIVSLPVLGCRYALARRLASSRSQSAVHLWAGKALCAAAVEHGLGDAAGVYTFNSAGLELLQEARRRRILAVVEQTIAPARILDSILATEAASFPQWPVPVTRDRRWAEYSQREREEWHAADLIICGSEFVRAGISGLNGPVDRCVVVPYGYDPARAPVLRRTVHTPIRALFVGEVGLRKGAPYLLRAARMAQGLAQFRAVGPLAASPRRIGLDASNLQWTGSVPRSLMAAQYAWADVFVLPSLCEGSATVCYEAMAAGLPVITTPNAGSVVRDGIDGYIVPVRDTSAVVAALESLAGNPGLLERMSANAIQRAAQFSLAEYSNRLLAALERAGRTCPAPLQIG